MKIYLHDQKYNLRTLLVPTRIWLLAKQNTLCFKHNVQQFNRLFALPEANSDLVIVFLYLKRSKKREKSQSYEKEETKTQHRFFPHSKK